MIFRWSPESEFSSTSSSPGNANTMLTSPRAKAHALREAEFSQKDSSQRDAQRASPLLKKSRRKKKARAHKSGHESESLESLGGGDFESLTLSDEPMLFPRLSPYAVTSNLMEGAGEDMEKLRTHLSQTIADCKMLRTRLNSEKNENHTLKNQISDLTSKLKSTRSELNDVAVTLQELQASTSFALETRNRHEEELERRRTTIAEQRQRIAELETKNADLLTQLDSRKIEKNSFERKMNEMREWMTRLEEELSAAHSTVSALKKEKHELQEDKTDLEYMLEAKKKRVAMLEEHLQDATKDTVPVELLQRMKIEMHRMHSTVSNLFDSPPRNTQARPYSPTAEDNRTMLSPLTVYSPQQRYVENFSPQHVSAAPVFIPATNTAARELPVLHAATRANTMEPSVEDTFLRIIGKPAPVAVSAPVSVPTVAPTTTASATAAAPAPAPAHAPAHAPVHAPVAAPVAAHVPAPVTVPVIAPVAVPVAVSTSAPASAPAPTAASVPVPVPEPSSAVPVSVPGPVPVQAPVPAVAAVPPVSVPLSAPLSVPVSVLLSDPLSVPLSNPVPSRPPVSAEQQIAIEQLARRLTHTVQLTAAQSTARNIAVAAAPPSTETVAAQYISMPAIRVQTAPSTSQSSLRDAPNVMLLSSSRPTSATSTHSPLSQTISPQISGVSEETVAAKAAPTAVNSVASHGPTDHAHNPPSEAAHTEDVRNKIVAEKKAAKNAIMDWMDQFEEEHGREPSKQEKWLGAGDLYRKYRQLHALLESVDASQPIGSLTDDGEHPE